MAKTPKVPGAPKTPREEASAATKASLSDAAEYKFARKSKYSNMGEDVAKSARHLANEWRGLEHAEQTGTAKALVTRDQLLKLEPPELTAKTNRKNVETALAMHYALSRMPAKPSVSAGASDAWGDDHVVRREWTTADGRKMSTSAHVQPDSGSTNVRDITAGEMRKKAREDYFNLYRSLRDKAHDLVDRNVPAGQAVNDMRSHVANLIRDYRSQERFHPLANDLVNFHNSVLAPHAKNAKSVVSTINDFHKQMAEQYPNHPHIGAVQELRQKYNRTDEDVKKVHESPHAEDYRQKMVDHALSVMEGKSMNAAFGKKTEKGKEFTPADLYVKHAERVGPATGMEHSDHHSDYLKTHAGFRAVQWGNSVTDPEREHHLKHASQALYDLTDTLGLPKEMASYNGRLALAIGARGKGRALAHYEPELKTINLTRKKGVGSLAHEWAHFFDDVMGSHVFGGHGNYYSNMHRHDNDGKQDGHDRKPLQESMASLQNYLKTKVAPRMAKDNYEKNHVGHEQLHSYWLSGHELFARAFEKYLDHKMKSKGRKNTYLTGVSDHYLWPTDQETQELSPMFDQLFSNFQRSPYLKKSLTEAMERMAKSSSLQDALKKANKSIFDVLGRNNKKPDGRSREQKIQDALKQQGATGSPYAEGRDNRGVSGKDRYQGESPQAPAPKAVSGGAEMDPRIAARRKQVKDDANFGPEATAKRKENAGNNQKFRENLYRDLHGDDAYAHMKEAKRRHTSRPEVGHPNMQQHEDVSHNDTRYTIWDNGKSDTGHHYFTVSGAGTEHFVRTPEGKLHHIPEEVHVGHTFGTSGDKYGAIDPKISTERYLQEHHDAKEYKIPHATAALQASKTFQNASKPTTPKPPTGGGKPKLSVVKSESPEKLAAEHERLVDVLKSPSHKDDLQEAKRQEKELQEYKAQMSKSLCKREKAWLDKMEKSWKVSGEVPNSPELEKARVDEHMKPSVKRMARDERRIEGKGADKLASKMTSKPGVSKQGLAVRAKMQGMENIKKNEVCKYNIGNSSSMKKSDDGGCWYCKKLNKKDE